MKILCKSFNEYLLKYTDQEFVDVLAPLLNGVNIINAHLVKGLNGIATPSKIYIDIDNIMSHNSNGKYDLAFIILHELAHYKRIKKKGKEWYLDYILRSDMESYVTATIFEEMFADRWSKFIVNILYDINLPPRNRDYKPNGYIANMSRYMHATIAANVKTEEDLNNTINQYVLNVKH